MTPRFTHAVQRDYAKAAARRLAAHFWRTNACEERGCDVSFCPPCRAPLYKGGTCGRRDCGQHRPNPYGWCAAHWRAFQAGTYRPREWSAPSGPETAEGIVWANIGAHAAAMGRQAGPGQVVVTGSYGKVVIDERPRAPCPDCGEWAAVMASLETDDEVVRYVDCQCSPQEEP
jgi:hypothetical protein